MTDEDSVVLAHERCGVLVMLILATVRGFRAECAHAFGLLRPLRPGDLLFESAMRLFKLEQHGIADRGTAQIQIQCDGLADRRSGWAGGPLDLERDILIPAPPRVFAARSPTPPGI